MYKKKKISGPIINGLVEKLWSKFQIQPFISLFFF